MLLIKSTINLKTVPLYEEYGLNLFVCNLRNKTCVHSVFSGVKLVSVEKCEVLERLVEIKRIKNWLYVFLHLFSDPGETIEPESISLFYNAFVYDDCR